jgi:hypothetical protein
MLPPKMTQTQTQADQKAKQLQMNKIAAQKLLAGIHSSLARNRVSTITLTSAIKL